MPGRWDDGGMSRARATAAILITLAWVGAGAASARAQSSTSRPTVLELELTGVVDPFMASFVERGISLAERNQDAAVLLTIDTPGGLDSSMRGIVKSILGSTVPVICYTSPSGARAASAGTFIMFACPINAMAPGTNIGAAHPVGVSGAIESEKVTNDAAAFIRSLADRWHRNADWAERAVRDAISAPAEDAVQLHVVDFVAPDARAAVAIGPCYPSTPRPTTGALADPTYQLNLCGFELSPFKMSVSESLFHSFADPNIAFLLLNIGFIALIVWVIHPGLHVSLGVGVVCLALGLVILETLPVRLTGVILVLVAAVLFVLDLKAKAHGVLTAAGIGVLILGGLLLFNPAVPSAHVSLPVLITVPVLAGLFSGLVLGSLLKAKKAPIRAGKEAIVGTVGVTVTKLDPSGMVRARGETWSGQSVAGFIAADTPVRVIDIRGITLEVEPALEGVETTAGQKTKEEAS
jgi:membrane-bound serine protease (ClpP class)